MPEIPDIVRHAPKSTDAPIDGLRQPELARSSPQQYRSTAREPKYQGNLYGTVALSHDASAHLGNNIYTNNVYNNVVAPDDKQAQLEQSRYEILLSSLKFPRMGARARNVPSATPSTCDWLFSQHKFADWLDDDRLLDTHGFIWIKGKPGCGKSTIMKRLESWSIQKWAKKSVFSYFFNARASEILEKSPLGLYRSLTYHLLAEYADMRALFVSTLSSKERDGEVDDWTEVELQEFLISCVQEHVMPPVLMIIDALDEGQDDDIQEMILWFEDLTTRSTQEAINLRICFSSRHYPHIEIKYGLSLVLENESGHDEDIITYLRKTLLGDDSQTVEALRSAMLLRSQGIFLWIVLVTPMLNKIHRHGKGITAMHSKLKDVPQGLHELFGSILLREADDFAASVTLFQWMLYAQRTLNPAELYAAVQHRHTSLLVESTGLSEGERRGLYLLHCSRGLVEISDLVVQFIHESVREFLLTNGTAILAQHTSPASNQYSLSLDAARSHATIGLDCLEYLHRQVDQEFPYRACDVYHFNYYREVPLGAYAANNWWQHARKAEDYEKKNFIGRAVKLLSEPVSFKMWKALADRDTTAHKSNVGTDDIVLGGNSTNMPVYYASKFGLPDVVYGMLQAGNWSCVWDSSITDGNTLVATDGSLSAPVVVAARHGHVSTVNILLQSGATPYFALVGLGHSDSSEASFLDILDITIKENAVVNDTVTVRLMLNAISLNYLRVIKMLISAGININETCREQPGSALIQAIRCRRSQVVDLLITAGANVALNNHQGLNPLVEAVRVGDTDITSSLLRAGADANVLEISVRAQLSAISVAISVAHLHIVQLLLRHGARVPGDMSYMRGTFKRLMQNAAGYHDIIGVLSQLISHPQNQNSWLADALLAAIECDNDLQSYHVSKYLISEGADIFTRDDDGSSLWAMSVLRGNCMTLQHLLDCGLVVNLTTVEDEHILRRACNGRHESAIRVLLTRATLIQVDETLLEELLLTATERGWIRIVEFLLTRGTDVHVRSVNGDDVLMVASEKGELEIAKMALAAGADPCAKHKVFGTCLQVAITFQQFEVLKVLLEHCYGPQSDVAAVPSLHDALLTAIEYDSLEAVTILFAYGGPSFLTTTSMSSDPLYHAIRFRSLRCTYFLLPNGHDIEKISIEDALLRRRGSSEDINLKALLRDFLL